MDRRKLKYRAYRILAGLGLIAILTIVILAFTPSPPQPFTAQAYEEICRELSGSHAAGGGHSSSFYNVLTARDYFNGKTDPDKVNIILVHESDWQLYDFPSIEAKYGLHSTLLVRPWGDTNETDYFYSDNIIKLMQWQRDGWEVGFHYDTLSKSSWDLYNATNIVRTIHLNGTVTSTTEILPLRDSLEYDAALQRFSYELNVMRSNFNISTISAHRDLTTHIITFPNGTIPANYTLPQNGHIATLTNGGEVVFIDRSDIDNGWLFEKRSDVVRGELGLRDLSEIHPTILISDAGGIWPVNLTQTLREAKIGSIVLIVLNGDYWK